MLYEYYIIEFWIKIAIYCQVWGLKFFIYLSQQIKGK